ncbi:hypothetical protein TSMEX_003640 [Taenia solium]|eukprot:TsM_000638800 transcript=TsM_000638800 gene=TsM_000638800
MGRGWVRLGRRQLRAVGRALSGEVEKLLLSHGGHIPPDISDREFADPGTRDSDLPQCHIFDQKPGEMQTASQSCNVTLVWGHLQAQMREAWEGWNYAEFFILLKYILISRWLRLTAQEVRQRLPKASAIPEDGRVVLRVLDEQVEILLSDMASAEPLLVECLTASSVS